MCVFCEIINGNIPSKKVYEDNEVLAILDISQATEGHTLVLPKKHFDNILEIDKEIFLPSKDFPSDHLKIFAQFTL